jgi:hypothetical protein
VRRLFWIGFGAAAGVLVARSVRQTAAELTPTNIATKTWAGVRDFWDDVREVAADREDELRESFGLDDEDGSGTTTAPDSRGL